MYAMFVMVGTSGLMVTAQLAPVAKDFAIDTVAVSMLGLTMPALSFALSMGLVLNGLSRPFFGWMSDHIGRENTMFIAFTLEGIGIYALFMFASDPVLFVLFSGLVYFAWGEIFALFPATCTDIYGRKFATANYGMLYTAKGTAALLVPLANVLAAATGGWTAVFAIASLLNLVAATLALGLLKQDTNTSDGERKFNSGYARCLDAIALTSVDGPPPAQNNTSRGASQETWNPALHPPLIVEVRRPEHRLQASLVLEHSAVKPDRANGEQNQREPRGER
jgi:MFS family permease